MAELHFNINPLLSLGDLSLYQSLNSILSLLSESQIQVEVHHNDTNPQQMPIKVQLVKYGIELIFEPKKQRLVFIKVSTDTKNTRLLYGGEFINDWTLANLYNRIFSPTTRVACYSSGVVMLDYPGLTLSFDVDPEIVDLENGEQKVLHDLLLKSKKYQVECQNLYIHKFETFEAFVESQESTKDLNDQFSSSSDSSTITISKIEIIPSSQRLELSFCKHPHNLTSLSLKLNESNQPYILHSLGPPDEIFRKRPSKLQIHSHQPPSVQKHTDFIFHNYFKLGFDLLYDHSPSNVSKFGTLVKIILHCNSPTGISFGTYEKSPFIIPKWNIDSSSSFDTVTKALKDKEGQEPGLLEPLLIMRDSSETNLLGQSMELVDHSDFHHVDMDDYCEENEDERLQKSLMYVFEGKEEGSSGMVWEVLDGDIVESLTLF